MRNHLWCPNDPRGEGIDDDDDDNDDDDDMIMTSVAKNDFLKNCYLLLS